MASRTEIFNSYIGNKNLLSHIHQTFVKRGKMRSVHTLSFSLAVMLNCIELSYQSDRWRSNDLTPHVSHGRHATSSYRNSPNTPSSPGQLPLSPGISQRRHLSLDPGLAQGRHSTSSYRNFLNTPPSSEQPPLDPGSVSGRHSTSSYRNLPNTPSSIQQHPLDPGFPHVRHSTSSYRNFPNTPPSSEQPPLDPGSISGRHSTSSYRNLTNTPSSSQQPPFDPGFSHARHSTSSYTHSPNTNLSLAPPQFSASSSHSAPPPLNPDVSHGRHSISDASSSLPPYPSAQNFPDTTLSLALPFYFAPAEAPAGRRRSRTVLGFPVKEANHLSITSNTRPNWTFQLHIYTFPLGEPILFETKRFRYHTIPNERQIVLLNSEGDVFALLIETRQGTVACRLYVRNIGTGEENPGKININSGRAAPLSSEEILQCPLDNMTVIQNKFQVFFRGRPV